MTPDSGGKWWKNACVLTVGVSLISAVVVELTGFSSLPPSPFPGVLGGPFVFPRGHLFTVAGTLWALVLHVRSSIRLVVRGPPLTGIGVGPVYIAVSEKKTSGCFQYKNGHQNFTKD